MFVLLLSGSKPGGIRAAARTSQPFLQIFRGVLLALEMFVMMWAIVFAGLVQAHALFACHQLIVTAFAGWDGFSANALIVPAGLFTLWR